MTVTAAPPSRAGPAALETALAGIDLDKLEAEARETVRSGPASKRSKAVHRLRVIAGLRKNGVKPSQLMIRNIPVIPPLFRPFGVAGEALVPGAANELYGDVFKYREMLREIREELGEQGAGDARLAFYDTTRALYGYGDPVNPKTRGRGAKGFLRQVTGVGPKYSFAQRKLFAKTQDGVSLGVIGIDPDLGLDEIGLPEKMAWTMYAPHVQGRLVRSGMPPVEALRAIKDQTPQARKALDLEMAERPVSYTRSPAWHKFNSIGGWPKIVPGNAIKINALVTTGQNADFDGDQDVVHVPATPEGVRDVKERLMPSKMLLTIRDPEVAMPLPKHEHILGLSAARQDAPKNRLQFASYEEAIEAAKAGKIRPEDEIEYPD